MNEQVHTTNHIEFMLLSPTKIYVTFDAYSDNAALLSLSTLMHTTIFIATLSFKIWQIMSYWEWIWMLTNKIGIFLFLWIKYSILGHIHANLITHMQSSLKIASKFHELVLLYREVGQEIYVTYISMFKFMHNYFISILGGSFIYIGWSQKH